MKRRRGRTDPVADARRAGAADKDERFYAWQRARQSRRRAEIEREQFDPGPPAEDDWTMAEEHTDGVRRVSPPTTLSASLDAFVRRRGWDERLRGAAVWAQWDQIVGPDLAQRCEPVRVAGGTLLVRAESQVWATQLRYLTTQLKANAAEVVGADAVREVRIVVGPLSDGE